MQFSMDVIKHYACHSILTFQEVSFEEGVANLLVYGMCSGGVQSGPSPAKSEGRHHKVDVTLIHMVGVPESEGVSNICISMSCELASQIPCSLVPRLERGRPGNEAKKLW